MYPVIVVVIIMVAAAAGPLQQGHFDQGGHDAGPFEQIAGFQQGLFFSRVKGTDHRQ
jgi:hypothetical protein